MPSERVQKVLNKILRKKNNNSRLLKKFLLTADRGWLRINGQAPDKQFMLADYLFDDERIVFDFSGLSKKSKERFIEWFLEPHEHDAEKVYLNGAATSDYRGYTAEVAFSWWGRIVNQLFYKQQSNKWSLRPFKVTLKYQLTDMEIARGKDGLLISLNQFGLDEQAGKYHAKNDDQDKPLRNTKRLYLTDAVVDELINTPIEKEEYGELIASPHPYSVVVSAPEKRYAAMHDYRLTERFITLKPWYIRFARWFKSSSGQVIDNLIGQSTTPVYANNDPELLLELEDKKIKILRRKFTGEIIIIENRPDLDSLVCCGGGAKIFAHVGAYRAFEEAGIKTANFAGSSAGAIFLTLCYLGYTSYEIEEYFQQFNKDKLIYFEIDRSGFSTTAAMKAGLDYMIVKKVHQIINDHQIDKTQEGRQFLTEHVFNQGKITFDSLAQLKKRYPQCILGDKLIITSTKIAQRETRYFSHEQSPLQSHLEEVSRVGSTSASLPIVFKPTIFSDGEAYTDGGILSNLPTEVFQDDRSTFLRTEHGNCLKLVAFQFDNGPEHHILTSLVDRVYRENFILNWIYSLLTGVKDPASGWERDRLKLMRHSNQVILINTGDISATKFDLTADEQKTLIENGYQAASRYIDSHYSRETVIEPFLAPLKPWYTRWFNYLLGYEEPKPIVQVPEKVHPELLSKKAVNNETMYATFSSIDEALFYCCHRQRSDIFDKIADTAIASGYIKADKVNELRTRHFSAKETIDPVRVEAEALQSKDGVDATTLINNMRLFEVVYPIFQKLPLSSFRNQMDQKIFHYARHVLDLHEPKNTLKSLSGLKYDTHIFVQIMIELMTAYLKACESKNAHEQEIICQNFERLQNLLPLIETRTDSDYWGIWSIQPNNINSILETFENDSVAECKMVCNGFKADQAFYNKLWKSSQEVAANENINNRSLQRDRSFTYS